MSCAKCSGQRNRVPLLHVGKQGTYTGSYAGQVPQVHLSQIQQQSSVYTSRLPQDQRQPATRIPQLKCHREGPNYAVGNNRQVWVTPGHYEQGQYYPGYRHDIYSSR